MKYKEKVQLYLKGKKKPQDYNLTTNRSWPSKVC